VKKPLLEFLKDLAGLAVGSAALLYVIGFTVHWAYFRLLGIEISGQPFDYLRFAADYVTSIVSSSPQLFFAFMYYVPKLIHAPLLKSTILCSLLVVVCVVLYIGRKASKLDGSRKPLMVLWWSRSALIFISFWILFSTEFDIAKVRNVLQTVDPAAVQQMQNQVASERNLDTASILQSRGRDVTRIYTQYARIQQGSPGFQYYTAWFDPTVTSSTSTERRAVYLALLLLNLVLISGVTCHLRSLKAGLIKRDKISVRESIGFNLSRKLVVVFCAGFVMQLFLFPFVYATLGRNLSYPLVMLQLATPSNGSNEHSPIQSVITNPKANSSDENASVRAEGGGFRTHCVYLIVDSDNEVIVYDRLNFFQLKRIPRARILTVAQVFTASPFDSCSKKQDEFTPCETLWMSEHTPIRDF
jgi:hypothetical protein